MLTPCNIINSLTHRRIECISFSTSTTSAYDDIVSIQNSQNHSTHESQVSQAITQQTVVNNKSSAHGLHFEDETYQTKKEFKQSVLEVPDAAYPNKTNVKIYAFEKPLFRNNKEFVENYFVLTLDTSGNGKLKEAKIKARPQMSKVVSSQPQTNLFINPSNNTTISSPRHQSSGQLHDSSTIPSPQSQRIPCTSSCHHSQLEPIHFETLQWFKR